MKLEVENLNLIKNEKKILNQINFAWNQGEFICILGPNGAGKTSLINCLSQVETSYDGLIQLKNQDLKKYPPLLRSQSLSVLPQSHDMVFPFTVRELILMSRYPYHTKGFENEEDERIVDEIMRKTQIDSFSDRIIHSLSGGEQQRVWLAKTLAQKSFFMILDEPWNHLDYKFQNEMLKTIRDEIKKENKGVLWITHHLNVLPFCDRVVLMNEGQIQKDTVSSDPNLKKYIEEIYEINFFESHQMMVPIFGS